MWVLSEEWRISPLFFHSSQITLQSNMLLHICSSNNTRTISKGNVMKTFHIVSRTCSAALGQNWSPLLQLRHSGAHVLSGCTGRHHLSFLQWAHRIVLCTLFPAPDLAQSPAHSRYSMQSCRAEWKLSTSPCVLSCLLQNNIQTHFWAAAILGMGCLGSGALAARCRKQADSLGHDGSLPPCPNHLLGHRWD